MLQFLLYFDQINAASVSRIKINNKKFYPYWPRNQLEEQSYLGFKCFTSVKFIWPFDSFILM